MASSFNQVAENFVPPLLDAVLIDYQRNVPAAREPEVLSTMAIIVNKLGGHITAEIPQIFDAVFECTLNMINKVSISLGTEGKWGVRKALVLACWYFSWLRFYICKWKIPFSCSEGRQIVVKVEFLDSFRLI